MKSTRKRFTIALESSDFARLNALAVRQKPKLSRQFLVELAVGHLLHESSKPDFNLAEWMNGQNSD